MGQRRGSRVFLRTLLLYVFTSHYGIRVSSNKSWHCGTLDEQSNKRDKRPYSLRTSEWGEKKSWASDSYETISVSHNTENKIDFIHGKMLKCHSWTSLKMNALLLATPLLQHIDSTLGLVATFGRTQMWEDQSEITTSIGRFWFDMVHLKNKCSTNFGSFGIKKKNTDC